MIAATAPGKLFLTGEWAVLRGTPAIVVAVDRVVRVTIDGERGDGELEIESLAEGRTWRGRAAAGTMPDGDAGAVVAALRCTGPMRGRVVVDSRPFLVGERKLGLGRSAATIAATVVARGGLERVPPKDGGLSNALHANALFQDGHGSGADVVACCLGGVVQAARVDGGLTIGPRHSLPAGLQLLAGWTGESAATTPLVARFAELPDPPVFPELAATARAAADAIAAGDAAALCRAVDASTPLLARFGDETGLPVVTPGLRRLVAAAQAAGAAAKPSGAGGGDCGIALAPSAAVAAAVRAAWRHAGILPLDVQVASEGARRA